MSPTPFQRVLGETSLERKCLLFFGTSLLLLILGSFWWYGSAATHLIYENTKSNCRFLADKEMIKLHAAGLETDPENKKVLERNFLELEQLSHDWRILTLDAMPIASGERNPKHFATPDAWEAETLRKLKSDYRKRFEERTRGLTTAPQSPPSESGETTEPVPPIYETYKDVAPISDARKTLISKEYNYYQVVEWRERCISCHALRYGIPFAGRSETDVLAEMPFCAIKVSLPFANTQRTINRNHAIVLAIAIVTVFLSVLSLYAIVRFLIVRPVQHLQSVSQQVERGNYEARAEIETGDEFEWLADAFNGMLRHLVEAQTSLRESNKALDAKVDQLAQANMQLYEMNRLKSDFLANVSHELRTPLNSIIGFSDLLQGIETLNEKQKRFVLYIRNSGRGLLDMINDILDLAKMESGKMEVRPTEFQIGPLIHTQCDMVRSLADEKNIDISFDAPRDLPPLFQDSGKIGQILTNLLSNAIKFTPDGGSVRIQVERIVAERHEDSEGDENWLCLRVMDTGVGIPRDEQEAIFEKFRQGSSRKGDNLTREYSGTGLGLSIVRELCKLLRGEVTVTSELGRGSEFTVQIPWIWRPAPDRGVRPFEAVVSTGPAGRAAGLDLESTRAPDPTPVEES